MRKVCQKPKLCSRIEGNRDHKIKIGSFIQWFLSFADFSNGLVSPALFLGSHFSSLAFFQVEVDLINVFYVKIFLASRNRKKHVLNPLTSKLACWWCIKRENNQGVPLKKQNKYRIYDTKHPDGKPHGEQLQYYAI